MNATETFYACRDALDALRRAPDRMRPDILAARRALRRMMVAAEQAGA